MRDLSLFVTVTLIWWQEQVMVGFEVGWRVLNKHQCLPIKCELYAFSLYWVCYLLTNGNELYYRCSKTIFGVWVSRKCEQSVINLWGHEIGCEIVRHTTKVVAVGKSITLTNLKIHNTINKKHNVPVPWQTDQEDISI